jgi:hypothetical protein
MPQAEFQGYRYLNPDESDPGLSTFEVVPSIPTDGDFASLAREFQAVKFEAVQEPYRTDYKPEEIAAYINPDNPKLVAAEEKRLQAASRTDFPRYVHALIGESLGWKVTGVGHAEYVPGKDGSRTRLAGLLPRRAKAASPIDVTDIYVRPALGDIELQRKGIGSAILFSLLDGLPDDTPIVAYAYPINRLARPVSDSLSFKLIEEYQYDQPKNLFGKSFNRSKYNGPYRGDLRQLLIDQHPWLPYRVQVEDHVE